MEVDDWHGYVWDVWNELLPYNFFLGIFEELIEKKNCEFWGIEADRKIIQVSWQSKEILFLLPEPTIVYWCDYNFCFLDVFGINQFGKIFKLLFFQENGFTHECQSF